VAELARTQSSALHRTLEEAFSYIENKSFSTAFDGLFSEINLNSDPIFSFYPYLGLGYQVRQYEKGW
jgi:type I restriction enzyme M protein